MLEEELEVAVKVLVVGNGGVGKSSMIQRYCRGSFTHDYKKTIGVDFLERQIEVDGTDVRLMLWDTAGQEEYDAITSAYYRGAHICVLAFSTVDLNSFEAIEKWKTKVEVECGSILMALVQNKIDLIDESSVTPEEVESLAKRLKLHLFRTSVKENFNVDSVFHYLAKKYLERKRKQEETEKVQEVKTNCIPKFAASAEESSSAGNGQPFQIRPSKQRTKKKRTICTIL